MTVHRVPGRRSRVATHVLVEHVLTFEPGCRQSAEDLCRSIFQSLRRTQACVSFNAVWDCHSRNQVTLLTQWK